MNFKDNFLCFTPGFSGQDDHDSRHRQLPEARQQEEAEAR